MAGANAAERGLQGLLHPSQEVHRVVLNSISDAVFITDAAGAFTYICPNVEKIFGHSFEDVVKSEKISTLLGSKILDIDHIDTFGEIENIEHEIIDKRGEHHTLLVNVKRVSVEGGTLLYTCRDVTERKKTERTFAERNSKLFEEIKRARDKLRKLAREVVTAQEEERTHISRELHDETGQYLTALQIRLKTIEEHPPDDPEELRAELRSAVGLTDIVIERIRQLAQGLRPPSLDALGIRDTLEGLCEEVSRRALLEIFFDGQPANHLPDEVSICVYRLLQEALTNTVKHAKANRVQVHFAADPESVRLMVEDDGVGFDVATSSAEAQGLGIAGMKERISLLGGTLRIDSKKGRGTRLAAYLPFGETI